MSTRATCVTVDIESWSKRQVPEQLRAQRILAEVLDEACENAGLDHDTWEKQPNGDGEVAILPSDLDEVRALPDLIREIGIALRQVNRFLNEKNRLRLRMALATGLTFKGSNGFAGKVVIEACRLLDSAPVRQALGEYPHTDLAVVIPDALYRDVITQGFRDLGPRDFWPVRVELPDKGFVADAWVYVTDRTGGPEPPSLGSGASGVSDRCAEDARSVDESLGPGLSEDAVRRLIIQWREGRGTWAPHSAELAMAEELERSGRFKAAAERYAAVLSREPQLVAALIGLGRILAGGYPRSAMELLDTVLVETDLANEVRCQALDVRADCRIALGDYALAVVDLEEMTRLLPDFSVRPGSVTLLRLGQCHLELDQNKAAMQVWLYLLDRVPGDIEAYLRIGCLATREGRHEMARAYLSEGLRLTRTRPNAISGAGAGDFLFALYEVAAAQHDDAAADRLLGQAADADPESPKALVELAYRAGRRHDREAIQRLFSAALSRVPAGRRKVFGVKESSRAIAAEEGDVVLEILLRNDCIDKATFERAAAVRARPQANSNLWAGGSIPPDPYRSIDSRVIIY